MISLQKLSNAIRGVSGWVACIGDIVTAGAATQEPKRRKVVKTLQKVCANVEEAVDAASDAFVPLSRSGRGSPEKFAKKLMGFDRDGEVRQKFKPEGLCGDIDHLLVETRSWLSAIRWTWGTNEMDLLRQELKQTQSLDHSLQEYDGAVQQLRALGAEIASTTGAAQGKKVAEALGCIASVQRSLRACAASVRQSKNAVVVGK